MNKDSLSKHISRAQELMLDDNFNMMVESSARSYRGGDSGGNDLKMFEQAAFGSSSNNTPRKQYQKVMVEDTPATNYGNLPECLRDTFKSTPPMSGGESVSVIDNMDIKSLNESVQMQRQSVQPQIPQGYVDYSIIKMIVKECIEEAMKTNTQSLKGIRLTEGNKIQLLDTKGNLYEGTVELKKKLSKKKT